MDASTLFGKMLEAMIGTEEADADLWRKGYRAFYNCQPYSDMPSQVERNGWQMAHKDMHASGLRIIQAW